MQKNKTHENLKERRLHTEKKKKQRCCALASDRWNNCNRKR